MTVLDSPEVRKTVFPVSVGFYHEAGRLGWLDDDVELLEGVILKKMPKSPLHEWLVEKLWLLLQATCPSGLFVGKEKPLSCSDSEPEPDLAVILGDCEEYRFAHPTTAELVIEVVINTQQRDHQKAAIYAKAGVREYWIIEPEREAIHFFTGPAAEGYQTTRQFGLGESVASQVVPGVTITLAELLK